MTNGEGTAPIAGAVSKYHTTNDGVRLHYYEAGSGPALVMIPGWSQCAEQFRHQIGVFAESYRVIALDQRGHGASDKPAFGYKIPRLAADLHGLLAALDLHDVILLGHSMGCCVIWSYWDLFGAERVSKLVLVDEPPHLTANPDWTSAELEAAGSIRTPVSAYELCNALAGLDGEMTTRAMIGAMLTKACPEDVREWIFACNFRMRRVDAAALLLNHLFQDWRDVIPRIALPTLVIGGRVSTIPWPSVAWIASVIPGAELVIFEEEEGGNHFMFIENPPKFNQVVLDFLA